MGDRSAFLFLFIKAEAGQAHCMPIQVILLLMDKFGPCSRKQKQNYAWLSPYITFAMSWVKKSSQNSCKQTRNGESPSLVLDNWWNLVLTFKLSVWIARVIELPHLWVGSCGVQRVDEVRATPLSRRTTKCWSTQRGLACRQAHKSWEKNRLSLAIWYSPSDWLIFILWLVHPSTRRYNHLTLSITFPQTSCNKLLV
jgi:hypothetical protein